MRPRRLHDHGDGPLGDAARHRRPRRHLRPRRSRLHQGLRGQRQAARRRGRRHDRGRRRARHHPRRGGQRPSRRRRRRRHRRRRDRQRPDHRRAWGGTSIAAGRAPTISPRATVVRTASTEALERTAPGSTARTTGSRTSRAPSRVQVESRHAARSSCGGRDAARRRPARRGCVRPVRRLSRGRAASTACSRSGRPAKGSCSASRSESARSSCSCRPRRAGCRSLPTAAPRRPPTRSCSPRTRRRPASTPSR